MKRHDTFSGYHPMVTFLFFGLVLFFSMFFLHPACLVLSLACAFVYCLYLKGRKAVRLGLLVMLPTMLMAAVINPAFNHEGATILAYLPSGNPLTLESITYGMAAAAMLAAVIAWFSCFNEVITSDKFVYLFGRIIPALSLVLSMTLRFIPRFSAQAKLVNQARRGLGRGGSGSGMTGKVKNGIAVISVMVAWSLENAIETADSMKSRGYGLKGRTAYSIYRFDKRDKAALAWLLACASYVVAGWAAGALYWSYFPAMQGSAGTLYSATVFFAYLAICLTPMALNIREDRKWIRLQSKI